MNENEYTEYLISKEIVLLEKYRYNLRKTALDIVIKRACGYSKKYYKIMDEIERVVLEINNLESQKSSELTIIEQKNQGTIF